MQDQSRSEVIVPAAHKSEDGLHSDRGFHQRDDDLVKCIKFAGAVYPRCFDQRKGKSAFHILFHIEESDRCGDRRYDQGDEGVLKPHSGYQIDEPQCRYLSRDHHDHQDKRIDIFLEPEVICMYGVCCHGRKIYAQHGAAPGYDQTVEHSVPDRECAVYEISPVVKRVCAWQECEACLKFPVGTGCVDEQYVEPEQAEERDDGQNDVSDHSTRTDSHALLQFICLMSAHRSLPLSFIVARYFEYDQTQDAGHDKEDN